MGIKGIFGEIGPGQRIALAKLAIDTFQKTGRPFRIAVDISIWLFQIQSGKGGTNPALRTLYYRLLRLVSLCIQPLFVFDGCQKPPFKRNKKTSSNSPSLTDFNAKQLLKLFGFVFHVAPGEAEAECALLQREGIVDAVLSEDVDTLMFGCGKTLRNWSSEGSKGNHSPTHVTVYDAEATKLGTSGLDREGMVLVALMSGGDYITEGIPGCGIKVACEAARAGYGKSLCMMARTDNEGVRRWRDNLTHELQTNESKHFKTKHKALQIPETFPNKEVLGYYTHPVVSSAAKIIKLRDSTKWYSAIDVPGLRLFVAEAFDWSCRTGAKKFIRGLAPAMLVSKLCGRANRPASGFDDPVKTTEDEMELVKAICGRRSHFSTDGIPELRLLYLPSKIVGMDLDDEVDDRDESGRDGLAPIGENENIQPYISEEEQENLRPRPTSPTKRAVSAYDPMQPEKIWILETIVKMGVPLKVEDYEESLRRPQRPAKLKVTSKRATTKGGMALGALERYFPVTKTTMETHRAPSPTKLPTTQPPLPPAFLAPALESITPLHQAKAPQSLPRQGKQVKKTVPKAVPKLPGSPVSTPKYPISRKGIQNKHIGHGNPWTNSQLSPSTKQGLSRLVVSISKAGHANEESLPSKESHKPSGKGPDIPSATAMPPPSSPPVLRKHLRADTPPSTTQLPPSSLPEFQLPSLPKRQLPQARPRSVHQGIVSHGSRLHPTILDDENELHMSSHSDAALPTTKALVSVAQQSQSVSDPSNSFQVGKSRHDIINISSSPTPACQPASSLNIAANSIPNESLETPLLRNGPARDSKKRFLMTRESLEGAWKEVSEDEAQSAVERGRSRAWRLSAVEVVDMIGVSSQDRQ